MQILKAGNYVPSYSHKTGADVIKIFQNGKAQLLYTEIMNSDWL